MTDTKLKKMPSGKKPNPRRRYTHLNDAQKAEAITLWQTGAATLSDLSVRFKKSEETFSRLFKKLGVKKGEKAEEHSKEVAKEVEKSIVDDAGELAKRIREVKEDYFMMTRALRRLIWNELVKVNKDKKEVEVVFSNLKALEKAAQALRITREEAYVVLGIANGEETDPDDVPELHVKELTDEDIAKIQESAMLGGDDDDDLDMPDLEEMPELST